MGIDHSVYMANASGQDIHVIASLDPDWAIIDIFVDIGLMLLAVGELKTIATTGTLPAKLNTVRDLFKFLKYSAMLLGATASLGGRPAEAALSFISAVKKSSIRIGYNECKNIADKGVLEIYLNASGIAGLLGAKTVSMIVMSGDGKQVKMWNTGPDDSWIATSRQLIVRSKYGGSVWEEDANAGKVNWPVKELPLPTLPLPMPIPGLPISKSEYPMYAVTEASEVYTGTEYDTD